MIGGWIVLGLIALYFVFSFFRRRASSQGITNAEALRRAMTDGNASCTLIDVRTPEEYRAGHIPSAINIPHTRIGKKPPKRPKDSLLVLYCRSGSRARVARSHLMRLGFGRVANFGGLSRWDGPLVDGTRPGELAID